jgi:hypothetical protein
LFDYFKVVWSSKNARPFDQEKCNTLSANSRVGWKKSNIIRVLKQKSSQKLKNQTQMGFCIVKASFLRSTAVDIRLDGATMLVRSN